MKYKIFFLADQNLPKPCNGRCQIVHLPMQIQVVSPENTEQESIINLNAVLEMLSYHRQGKYEAKGFVLHEGKLCSFEAEYGYRQAEHNIIKLSPVTSSLPAILAGLFLSDFLTYLYEIRKLAMFIQMESLSLQNFIRSLHTIVEGR